MSFEARKIHGSISFAGSRKATAQSKAEQIVVLESSERVPSCSIMRHDMHHLASPATDHVNPD